MSERQACTYASFLYGSLGHLLLLLWSCKMNNGKKCSPWCFMIRNVLGFLMLYQLFFLGGRYIPPGCKDFLCTFLTWPLNNLFVAQTYSHILKECCIPLSARSLCSLDLKLFIVVYLHWSQYISIALCFSNLLLFYAKIGMIYNVLCVYFSDDAFN